MENENADADIQRVEPTDAGSAGALAERTRRSTSAVGLFFAQVRIQAALTCLGHKETHETNEARRNLIEALEALRDEEGKCGREGLGPQDGEAA